MKHSQIQHFAKGLLALVTLGLVGACADSAVAPTRQFAFKAPAGFDRVVGVSQFTVNGTVGMTRVLDNHTITIPANAICDPLLSTYGSGEWDQPCTPLSGSVTITATMMEDDAGRPYIDFQPALRFVPTKEVILSLTSPSADSATMLSIEYCNNLGFCIDEAVTDSSLVTRRLPNSAIAERRIKHFSGYMMGSGFEACSGWVETLPDGSLWCHEGSGRRSGYMVASGLVAAPDTGSTIAKKRNDH